VRIEYELLLETDESDERLEHLHQNLRTYSTLQNTLARAIELVGKVHRVTAPIGDEARYPDPSN
jgi:hypothetical protein